MDQIKIPKSHSLRAEFFARFRDAVFVADQEDKQRVERYLASQGRCWKEALDQNTAWIHRRVRRIVPAPDELFLVVRDLFERYGLLQCATTGRRVFDEEP